MAVGDCRARGVHPPGAERRHSSGWQRTVHLGGPAPIRQARGCGIVGLARLRSRERIATISGLADGSVCPHIGAQWFTSSWGRRYRLPTGYQRYRIANVTPSKLVPEPTVTCTGTLSPGCMLAGIWALIWNKPGISPGAAPAYCTVAGRPPMRSEE